MISFEQHMRQMAQPMRDQLTTLGITELLTPEDVEQKFATAQGTSLLVVNSVCGCAAGMARPAVALALQNEILPDNLFTVFAGQDKEATAKAREYLEPHPPSSPSMALMKNGQVVFMIPRHQIEDRSAEQIAASLIGAFNEYCSK